MHRLIRFFATRGENLELSDTPFVATSLQSCCRGSDTCETPGLDCMGAASGVHERRRRARHGVCAAGSRESGLNRTHPVRGPSGASRCARACKTAPAVLWQPRIPAAQTPRVSRLSLMCAEPAHLLATTTAGRLSRPRPKTLRKLSRRGRTQCAQPFGHDPQLIGRPARAKILQCLTVFQRGLGAQLRKFPPGTASI